MAVTLLHILDVEAASWCPENRNASQVVFLLGLLCGRASLFLEVLSVRVFMSLFNSWDSFRRKAMLIQVIYLFVKWLHRECTASTKLRKWTTKQKFALMELHLLLVMCSVYWWLLPVRIVSNLRQYAKVELNLFIRCCSCGWRLGVWTCASVFSHSERQSLLLLFSHLMKYVSKGTRVDDFTCTVSILQVVCFAVLICVSLHSHSTLEVQRKLTHISIGHRKQLDSSRRWVSLNRKEHVFLFDGLAQELFLVDIFARE